MKKDMLQIEIKKMLLLSLQNNGHSIEVVINSLLKEFLKLSSYGVETDSISRDISDYIIAYLQLGYSYLNHQHLFTQVLSICGIEDDDIAQLHRSNQVIICNKSQVRSLIGKWPPSPYNSHNITEVVNDIIKHINNNDYGTFCYYTAKKDGLFTALYQLIITPEINLFHDVLHNQFYNLTKK